MKTLIIDEATAAPAHAAVERRTNPVGLDLKRILVPIDLTHASFEALERAGLLAGQSGADLWLLHVIEPAPFISDLRNAPLFMSDEEAAERASVEMTTMAQAELESAIPVRPLVRVGKVHREIVAAARELKADLIILAAHAGASRKHTFLRSTVEKVVRQAPCAVLVLPGAPGCAEPA